MLFLRSISHDKLQNKSCRPPRMCTRLMHTIGRIFDNNERNISCATFWRKRGRMKCLVEGLNSKLTEQERQLNDKQRQMKGRSDIKESSLKQSPVWKRRNEVWTALEPNAAEDEFLKSKLHASRGTTSHVEVIFQSRKNYGYTLRRTIERNLLSDCITKSVKHESPEKKTDYCCSTLNYHGTLQEQVQTRRRWSKSEFLEQ